MKIKKKKAIALMEKAIEQRGRDWLFPTDASPMGCFYLVTPRVWADVENNMPEDSDTEEELHGLKEGDPACLVGVALSLLHNDTINRAMEDRVYDNITALSETLRLSGITFTNKALRVLDVAQAAQDTGSTWGEALDEAIANVC